MDANIIINIHNGHKFYYDFIMILLRFYYDFIMIFINIKIYIFNQIFIEILTHLYIITKNK